jgi:prepilin-type N-terminal cleavage/methylation domain-containing protein
MKFFPSAGTRGFTLIELSIVLIIIALVTGMAVSAGISVVATARLTATQQKMAAIDQALLQFRVANNRLPCPGNLTIAPGGTDFGMEAGADASSAIATGTGVCTGTGMLPQANSTAAGVTNTYATGAEGALPAITLGLPPDFMVDGWGNQMRYAVDISMTANAAFITTPVGCIDGAITVNDSNGNARSKNSIYALISHGPNGHGAYPKSGGTTPITAGSVNSNEQTNCHCNSSGAPAPASGAPAYTATYVQMQPTIDPSNSFDNFDDIVSYKERWQMQTPWDKTGVCPYIYVTDTNYNRVAIFNMSGTFRNGIGAGYNGITGSIGSSGTLSGQFSIPYSSTIDSSGNVWVVESTNNRVDKFNSSYTYQSQFPCTSGQCSTSSSNGQLHSPVGIAIDAYGNILVVDNSNNRIEKFNSSGAYLTGIGAGYNGVAGSIGSSGSANGQFDLPFGIAIDASGNLWVTDGGNNRVQEFNSSGTWLQSIGGPSPYTCETSPSGSIPACASGTGSGQFNDPQGIAIDASGNVWVADDGNNRVQEFNSSGTYQMGIGAGYNGVSGSIGSSGTSNGQFHSPVGIAIDASGNIWVVETSGSERVQEFTSSGVYISQFVGSFHSPQGIAISSR